MPQLSFAALFDRSPNPYMVVDRELRYVAVNEAYLQAVASKREELIGRLLFDAFPNDENDPNNAPARLVRASIERTFATGRIDAIPVVVYRTPTNTPDGIVMTERVWSAVHTPLLDDQGQVQHVLQHTVDVTDAHRLRQDAHARATGLQAESGVLKRAEEVQRVNHILDVERRHLRSLFEQAPVFVCFLRGKEHIFELANAAYRKLVGLRPDIMGRRVIDVFPEIVAQGFLKLLDQVFITGEPYVGQGVRLVLDQAPGMPPLEHFIDFIYQPIVDADGAITGIFVVGSDITEQTRTHEERERLAAIVEQTADFIGAADMDGKLLFVNDAGFQMLGLKREQVGAIKSTDFFMPDDLPFVMENIVPVLMGLGQWRGDFRMRHFVTGEAVPVDYHVFTIRDPVTGEVTGVASVTRDLRGLRELENQRNALARDERAARASAQAAEGDYRFLANAIPVQVWTAAPEGGLTYVNERVTDYFASSESSVLDAGWQNVVHPDDLAACVERWGQSLRSGDAYEVEFRLRRAIDESYRWHIARAVARRDESGNIEKWYGSNTDIDDQKRTTTERDELIKALEASNKELDRFAYVASHDLKTPLRGIGNIAQWLEDDLSDRLTEESRSHLVLLRGRVERMYALIDGVLKYSRAAKGDEVLQDVDVRELLEVVIDLLDPPSGVRIDIGAHAPVLHTAYVALQQVLLNLVSNAIKHAGKTEVRIDVRVTDDGPRWRFEVRDDGPGIDPAHHQKVWDMFQTLQPSQPGDPRGGNTGIGLPLVKRMVESRGGKVGVISAPGEGSTFWFTWPKHEGKPLV